jgi:hypothetical protein
MGEVGASAPVRAAATGEAARQAPAGGNRYVRHEPEATALHRLVKAHLESFVRFAAARSGRALPRYVVEEFRAYLRCGVLAHGFARARCEGCGHDLFVAFSCKLRGVCPSCGGRRMSATAADVVDRVLPEVPLRQWVLSVPFALRVRLAADPVMLNVVSRVLWEEMRRWYRGVSGLTSGDDVRVEAGAITFVQRFGGALNLNVHFHVVAADGVWRCPTDGSTPSFVVVRAPTRDDLSGVVARVVGRVERAFARLGPPGDAEDDALAGCQRAALARGGYGVVRADGAVEAGDAVDTARFGRRPPKAQVAETEGFNLHASVVIGARDAEGRERLLRYVARPAVALDRVSELPDGRVAWRLKQPGRRGETHRIMEPMEFMARLAALVPPPRHPLVRYHGVFAPNSPWRVAVVPGPRPQELERRVKACAAKAMAASGAATGAAGATEPLRATADAGVWDVVEATGAAKAKRNAPRASRIAWATLLRRVWGIDALKCPKCEGPMKFIATITDRAVIVRILTHLGLAAVEVVAAPARHWDDTS